MVVVPALEMSGKLEARVEISHPIMENGNSVELPEEKMMICASNREDNTFDDTDLGPVEKQVMTCANNCEDDTARMEVPLEICSHIMPFKDGDKDVEVDVVEDVKPNEERVAKREIGDVDVTESSGSSSFGNTDSGTESATVSSDVEVESQPQDVNASMVRFDGFRTRKKKLTDHWRKFIRPLMWRCRWAELQLRELRSQVSKYDRELEECDRKKQSALECIEKDISMKAVPFICHNRSVKLMKRKKRKRVEDTVDLASYTSNHSLFSYYARKKPFADSAYVNNDHGNKDVVPAKKTPLGSEEFGLSGGLALFKERDAFEIILQKVDEAQLLVHRLRMRVDKVVTEHAGKFTADVSSFVPDDPSASCAPNLSLPNALTEKTPPTSQHGQVRIEERCEKSGKDVQSYDQPVKEKLDNTNADGIQRAESPPLATVGKAEKAPHPNSASQKSATREQSTVKTRSISKLMIPKNKSKRGRRKARSSRWSRRSSG